MKESTSWTVQLDSALSLEDARKRLQDAGFEVTQTLPFAANLFAVVTTTGLPVHGTVLAGVEGMLWYEAARLLPHNI